MELYCSSSKEGVEGVTICMGMFYLVIVLVVSLYGADSLVVSQGYKRKLNSFHYRAVRDMTREHIMKGERGWDYPKHIFVEELWVIWDKDLPETE